jgi:hypothetical protein
MGTIIKGKRLPTLNSDNTPNENNRSATLSGSIKINDSKLSIIENGFVVLLSSDSRTPDVINASIETIYDLIRTNSKFVNIIKYIGKGDDLMGLTILFSYDYLHLTHPCICQYIETCDANTTELEKIIFS